MTLQEDLERLDAAARELRAVVLADVERLLGPLVRRLARWLTR